MKLKDGISVEKLCPLCGAKLLVRTNKQNGNQFLGCPRWPNCDHTEGIPESIKMKILGAQTLPGFDQ